KQYVRYLTAILHADLGPSYKYLDRGVKEIISDTLPTSALLGLLALLFALMVSFPTGLIAAYFRNSWIDRFALLTGTLGVWVPPLIPGPFLICLFRRPLG